MTPTTRILFYESSDSWSPVLRELNYSKDYTIVYWIGTNPACNKHVHELDFIAGADRAYENCAKGIYDTIYPEFPKFMDMYCRNYRPDKQNIYREYTVHQYLNAFNLLLEELTFILLNHRIDTVIISRIPHLGSEYLLYLTAKALGLRVIMLYQSIFPERFFVSTDWNDFGRFEKIPILDPQPVLPRLKQGFSHDWFYMDQSSVGARPQRDVAASIAKFRRYSYWIQAVRTSVRAIKTSVRQRVTSLPVALKATANRDRDYAARIKKIASVSPDLSQSFVYFPLHLQPEMTTSALGGVYVDQLLAVERLSTVLPKSFYIYVKENPKQTSFMRDELFFARLAALRNVVLIEASFPTVELLQRCAFVATITGTAGWEALLGGKNVVIFGLAWYRTLPGVFEFQYDLNLDAVLHARFAAEELNLALIELLRKTGKGITYSGYEAMVPGFDRERNIKTVTESIDRIIRCC